MKRASLPSRFFSPFFPLASTPIRKRGSRRRHPTRGETRARGRGPRAEARTAPRHRTTKWAFDSAQAATGHPRAVPKPAWRRSKASAQWDPLQGGERDQASNLSRSRRQAAYPGSPITFRYNHKALRARRLQHDLLANPPAAHRWKAPVAKRSQLPGNRLKTASSMIRAPH